MMAQAILDNNKFHQIFDEAKGVKFMSVSLFVINVYVVTSNSFIPKSNEKVLARPVF